jgi:hypothetical protein
MTIGGSRKSLRPGLRRYKRGMRAIAAALAVLFAGLTVAAYGSGTGPWSTSAAGLDVIDVKSESPAVPQAPVDDPAPAARKAKHPKADDGDEGDDSGDDEGSGHGKGHGLGNTYCQSLKGTGGPAFGHCIAAKAHELHQHGKHR